MTITAHLFKPIRLTAGAVLGIVVIGISGCFTVRNSVALPAGFQQAHISSIKPGSKKSNFSCPATPTPFVGALVFTSKYEGSDSSRSTVNPKAYQLYKNQTTPMVDLQKAVSALSSKYQYNGDPQVRACALGMLADWARAQALFSQETNHTGRAARKWTLAAASSSYAKLIRADAAGVEIDAKQKAVIENWLSTIANIVVVDYTHPNIDKVNNHDYWAAWAVGITGAVLERKDLLDWSYGKFAQAMSQVNDKGFLPNELKRKHFALSYHNFAVAPLVSLALVLNENHYSVLPLNNNALSRLVNKTLEGLAKPEVFQAVTGIKQTTDKLISPSGLAWLEPWSVLNPNSPVPLAWKSFRPLTSPRMGGDLTLLYAGQKVSK